MNLDNNGVHRPTVKVTMSTHMQSSISVSQSGTVTDSKEAAATESVSVWVAVGVGIAALIIVMAVATLVSSQLSALCYCMSSCDVQLLQLLQPFYSPLDFVRDYPGEPVPER